MTRTSAFLACLIAAPLLAEGPPAEKPALSSAELAEKQREIGERLAKIEETMKRIADQLAGQNPEQAARLRMAWQRSQADRNLEKIGEIEALLKQEYFSPAFDQQKNLEIALTRLLDILLDRDSERKELAEKIKQLEQINETLRKIIEEERGHFLNTEKFADPEKALQRAAAAKAKLEDLIARQRKLIDDTRAPAGDEALKTLQQRLKELQNDADAAQRLADDVAKHAEAMPPGLKEDPLGRRDPSAQAQKALARAAQSMRDGQPPQGDLREAEEALRRLEERKKELDQKRLESDQERIRKDTERLRAEVERLEKGAQGTDGGSGELGRAQGEMQEAEKGLSKGQNEQALPKEEAAKRELEAAMKKLEQFEKELKRLMELPDYGKLAKEQDDTADKTEEMRKKMEEQGARGQPDGAPTPGQGPVEEAKKAMQRASRNLRGGSAKGANPEQKEAVERLEKAQEELEEALRQLREEEQLMLLDAIERRLTRMLQKQTALFKETISLDLRLRDSKQPTRADTDKSRQIAEGEGDLATEAEKLLELLREEGTTIVIPDVVDDMRKDLDMLAARLLKLDAGAYVQQVQQDVIATLKELIEVIQEERDKKQGGQQGNGDGQEGDSEDNLLPTSAELKMLKSLQVRVNRRTSDYERLREKDEGERGRLAEKQGSVGALTRTMADKLNREEE